jgi:hypothetical protein
LKFDLGMKSDLEMLEEQDEIMRIRYYDPVKNFPDKIDQLLNALNRVIHFSELNCRLFYFCVFYYLVVYESTKLATKEIGLSSW